MSITDPLLSLEITGHHRPHSVVTEYHRDRAFAGCRGAMVTLPPYEVQGFSRFMFALQSSAHTDRSWMATEHVTHVHERMSSGMLTHLEDQSAANRSLAKGFHPFILGVEQHDAPSLPARNSALGTFEPAWRCPLKRHCWVSSMDWQMTSPTKLVAWPSYQGSFPLIGALEKSFELKRSSGVHRL
ncbi:hypothetical protein LZ31DRAFT_555844 [Colletotrichum somersetense]|nr:hypothetical protein LZ31DRAFT_555844 [Colletotrichum somersetense]